MGSGVAVTTDRCITSLLGGKGGGGWGGAGAGGPLSYMNNDVMHTAIYATKVVYRSILHGSNEADIGTVIFTHARLCNKKFARASFRHYGPPPPPSFYPASAPGGGGALN